MLDSMYLNDEILGYGALKNDLLFHKIPKDKYQYYINKAIEIGKQKAISLKQYSIKELCNKNHIDITYASQTGKFYGVTFRANIELSESTRKITLYKDSMQDMLNAIKASGIYEYNEEEITNIHLAHELYHFYEYIDKQPTNEILDTIVRYKLGPIKLHSSITSVCEIAAHAFTKELLDLDFLPNIFDYMLLVYQEKITIKDLEELFKQWNHEIGE
ncbi:MAG: hypothetical protein ACK5LC_01385 [Coprobacillaceae bacterium]